MLSCVKADERCNSTLQAVFRTDIRDILCVLIVHLPARITAVGSKSERCHIAVKQRAFLFAVNEDTASVRHDEKAFSSCKQTVIAVHEDTLVYIKEISDLRDDLVDPILVDTLACHIFVIDEGGIMEQGTAKELLAKKGAYYDLYMAQFAV